MADLYPLQKQGKVIGSPYSGTHAVAFNSRGGTDNWQSENAVDIATPTGTPVVAVADGTIGPRIGAQGGGRFAGLRVSLVTGDNEFFYGHLSRLTVKAGETVQAGQVIGYTGSANGVAHLHFASRTGSPTVATDTPPGPQPVQPQPEPQAQPDTSLPSVQGPPSSAQPLPGGGPQLPGGGPQMPGTDLYEPLAALQNPSPDTLNLIRMAGGTNVPNA